ncbi:MAG TPA: DUF4352 domain-containing protein, partial [Patescibacteria group bacterium]|nr:DUF4352 domain-containing protein [Patescibacteria group bacterium]
MTVNCKGCGKEIGKGVKKCIHCGADQRSFFGKHKIITGILVIAILGGIGSIFGENNPQSSKTSATQQKIEKRAFKIGETFKSNAFEVTITGKDTTKRVNDKSGYLYSDADGVFVGVHVHYKNIADSAKSLDSGAFKLVADGKQYSPTIMTIRLDENIFHSQINPGIEKDGDIYFDVPESVANSNLTLK